MARICKCNTDGKATEQAERWGYFVTLQSDIYGREKSHLTAIKNGQLNTISKRFLSSSGPGNPRANHGIHHDKAVVHVISLIIIWLLYWNMKSMIGLSDSREGNPVTDAWSHFSRCVHKYIIVYGAPYVLKSLSSMKDILKLRPFISTETASHNMKQSAVKFVIITGMTLYQKLPEFN